MYMKGKGADGVLRDLCPICAHWVPVEDWNVLSMHTPDGGLGLPLCGGTHLKSFARWGDYYTWYDVEHWQCCHYGELEYGR